MKYFVQVDGEPHEVEVTETLGRLSVRLDGEPVDFSYREVDRLGQVALILNGRTYGISIEGDGNASAVTVAGHLYSVEIEDERERAAHAAERERTKGGGTVLSIMPGVVVRLLVAEGDLVVAGQPLLILEAMKMQNEIPAPSNGRVARILVEEGVAVASGTGLVVVEATE